MRIMESFGAAHISPARALGGYGGVLGADRMGWYRNL